MSNERNECCGCQPLCEPTELLYEKCNDCEKTKGLPMPESFYDDVTIQNHIDKKQLPPFTIRVSKLPHNEKGIITIGGKEHMLYEYKKNTTLQLNSDGILVPISENKPGEPGELTIVKRGLSANGTFNGVDGQGLAYHDVIENGVKKRYLADYNNCKYMYRHNRDSSVTIDANHLFIRMATAMTCCRASTEQDCGTVKISKVCPEDGECPTAVSICDFANCGKRGILRELSKCVPDGKEIAVAWNDWATQTRPGITQVTNVRVRDCSTGSITTQTLLTGENIPTALNAFQYADKDIYGSVTLSIGGANHIAHANNHHANTETAGLVKLRQIKQNTYEYINPNDVQRFGDPLANCGNKAKTVISDYDWADENTHGLVLLSNPSNCERVVKGATTGLFPAIRNIALNKYDYARNDNVGSTKLSLPACNPCNPIAVGDNDPRLFKPFLKLHNIEQGGASANWENDWPVTGSRNIWNKPITYKFFSTNLKPKDEATNCENKNSTYYGIQRNADELATGSVDAWQTLIVPKSGMYNANFQIRMFIDPNINGTVPYGIAQARIQVKQKKDGRTIFTTMGDKKEWIHRSYLQDLHNIADKVGIPGQRNNWWKVGDMSNASGEKAGSDVFLQAHDLVWLDEGDEVWVSCDLDTDNITDYRVYRQRFSLEFVDATRYEVR